MRHIIIIVCSLYHAFSTLSGMYLSLTPHSALLHVGLKSQVPTGLQRNIS
ncbi:hypothetical protein Barb4_02036 [Bacteroidales bacterium Barb4]|nr:hypothetical protein Barb4_02036 [Bacteroidales bacterium Barb4]